MLVANYCRKIARALSLNNEWIFIGLNDKQTEGTWLWVNGNRASTDDSSLWYGNEPDNDPYDCADSHFGINHVYGFKAFDRNCNSVRKSLCEKLI